MGALVAGIVAWFGRKGRLKYWQSGAGRLTSFPLLILSPFPTRTIKLPRRRCRPHYALDRRVRGSEPVGELRIRGDYLQSLQAGGD